MPTTAYPINPQLTALAIAYINPDDTFIADRVLPRVPTAKKFSWLSYSVDQGFTVPPTMLGRKSEPREVEFQATSLTDETVAYGLVDYVPNEDIEVWNAMPKAAGTSSPTEVATMMTVNLLRVAREQRAANLLFNAATYLGTQQQTLAGTSQWSDYANSDPALAIGLAMDSMLIRPNKLVIGQQAYTRLRRHPKIIQAAFPISQSGNGRVTAAQLAEVLELDSVEVGTGFINTAAEGAAPTLQRLWGKHAALVYSSGEAALQKRPTFGFTANFGNIEVQSWNEPKRGYKGVVGIKPIEHVKELIVAQNCGYYFQNCTV